MPIAWLHSLNPDVLRISEHLAIKWYGLSYLGGFVLAWLVLKLLSRARRIMLSDEEVSDLLVSAVLGVIIGGRLGYVLIYSPELLWKFTSRPPWWSVLAINEGGMASHGGMVGVAIAAILAARRINAQRAKQHAPRVSIFHVLDILALVTPIGLGLGRVANFINGELLGRVVALPGKPAPWWAVRFPQEVISGHDADDLMEPAAAALRRSELADLVSRHALPSDSFERGYERALDALHRGDPAVARAIEPLISARHPSQLYQAMAEGLILGACLWLIWRVPRKPGLIAACFLIVYGALRIFTELWRLPDAGLKVPTPLGLSRGQWLSTAMILSGIAIWRWSSRRHADPLGGWGPRGRVVDDPSGSASLKEVKR